MNNIITNSISFNPLSKILLPMILSIGISVLAFTFRYARSEINKIRLFTLLSSVILFLSVAILSENVFIFAISFLMGNISLIFLIGYNIKWGASYNAAAIASKNLIISFIFLISGFLMIYLFTGMMSFHDVNRNYQKMNGHILYIIPLLCILLGAMMQSGLWPFHRWILNSLNSPTPASAIMHAGLINGGGIIIILLAQLYSNSAFLMTLICIIGFISAFKGTFYKLAQSNIKGMFASSTISQMGFMFIQCGLGFFSLAVSHIIFHAFFKAYLFLNSRSAAQYRKYNPGNDISYLGFIYGAISGLMGIVIFICMSGEKFSVHDSGIVVLFFIFISLMQLGIALMHGKLKKLPLALVSSILVGFFYGSVIRLIHSMIDSALWMRQELNYLHILMMITFSIAWLCVLFYKKLSHFSILLRFYDYFYVRTINAIQPCFWAINSSRNEYMQSKEIVGTNLNSSIENSIISNEYSNIHSEIKKAFAKISPSWPLKGIIARNPLMGFEDLKFSDAISEGEKYFQQNSIPRELHILNYHTIKWCQSFFDAGQALMTMREKKLGFYNSLRKIIIHDSLFQSSKYKDKLVALMDLDVNNFIKASLQHLKIEEKNVEKFLSIILTSMPGWAGYVKYRTEWDQGRIYMNNVTQEDYLGIRLMLLLLICNDCSGILRWFEEIKLVHSEENIKKIEQNELEYQALLFRQLKSSVMQQSNILPSAQFVFCIDVRSEPFRKNLESVGNYKTFGFAGFFGLPVTIYNKINGISHNSCPVIVKSVEKISIGHIDCTEASKEKYLKMQNIIDGYRALKYNATTPFTLAEIIGLWSGIFMLLRSLIPNFAEFIRIKLRNIIYQEKNLYPDISCISFENQCKYAESALKSIGLVDNFAPFVFLCGHRAQTLNNAFATSLECGACGGNSGGINGLILAEILNQQEIRKYLKSCNIIVPRETIFLGAEHNTTTDALVIYSDRIKDENILLNIESIKKDLVQAALHNIDYRLSKLNSNCKQGSHEDIIKKSVDFAEIRPEWGLAGNASFIIGDISLEHCNLDGRSFLHSYNYLHDKYGGILKNILGGPMAVCHWINSQYMFSTIDNTAYGSGNKMTHNVTCKIGVMQGNGSDLMYGMPLQSVYLDEKTEYHKPLRLTCVIYGKCDTILIAIKAVESIKRLVMNDWIYIYCIDPENESCYRLSNALQFALYS